MRLIKRVVNILFWLLLLAYGACFFLDAVPLEERVCAPIRMTVSHVTSGLKIPIFEIMVVGIPILLIAMLACGHISPVLTVAKLLLAAYIVTLGVPARLPPRISGISEPGIEEYKRAASLVCERINALTPSDGDASSTAALAARTYATDKLNVQSGIAPVVKASLAPALLTDMGIVAYYAFASAEIVLNGYAPDFMIAFAAAHETTHFLGITNEDEANLFAFAALAESGDETLEFSAYLCAFVYIGAVICSEDRDAYDEMYADLPASARELLDARHDFLERSDGRLGAFSDTLNDVAISLRDSRGAQSYSYTSRLLVAYLLQ